MSPTGQQPNVITDERDILRVLVRYATAIDTKNYELLRQVFCPRGQFEYPDRLYEDLDELIAIMDPWHARLDATQHRLFNHVIDVDGDTATHTCYVEACFVEYAAPGPDYLRVHGRYEDRLVRTPDGWRISARRFVRGFEDGNWYVGGHIERLPEDWAARVPDEPSPA
jgi:hypothetical protein